MLVLRFTRSLQSSVCILHPAYVLPQSSVCILPQVRSLRFTLTGSKITTKALNHLLIISVFSYCKVIEKCSFKYATYLPTFS